MFTLINYCYSDPFLNARWVCFSFTFDDGRVQRDIKIILAIYGGIMMMRDKRRAVRENRNSINKQCWASTVSFPRGITILHRLFSMWQLLHVWRASPGRPHPRKTFSRNTILYVLSEQRFRSSGICRDRGRRPRKCPTLAPLGLAPRVRTPFFQMVPLRWFSREEKFPRRIT